MQTETNAARISTDIEEMNVDWVHQVLSTQSYWAKGIPKAIVQRSMQNSLCFGVFIADRQIGFARVITDKASFANLVDVFILPEQRGHGYSKQLMSFIMAHPDLQGLRRFSLATTDAHGLYAQFGFTPLAKPENLMERCAPLGFYEQSSTNS
jgi:N-acetylglutamate synthase-like GNAT family acetyltransferase